jgi:pyridoxine 5-phosphate synthase
MKLSVNVDHIATLRNARKEREPDPVLAALMAELAGAVGIVCHLREDRRHITDDDLRRLRDAVKSKLDLEMAATDEMKRIAIATKPDLVTLVPEKREELTTEGGLDVQKFASTLKPFIADLQAHGIPVSLFIEPTEAAVKESAALGANLVELHTGKFAELTKETAHRSRSFVFAEADIDHELMRLEEAAHLALQADMRVVAGHGLDYRNITLFKDSLFGLIEEVSIGYALIARAAIVGIDTATREMIRLLS